MSYDKKEKRLKILCIHLLLYVSSFLYFIHVYSSFYEYLVFLIVLYINFLSLINLLLVNPGYICKKIKNMNIKEEVCYENGIEVLKNFIESHWVLIIKKSGDQVTYKYCEECNIYKIKGISHCYDCNCCVHEMDHHCYWLDTCIARNNIREFYVYLFTNIFIISYFSLFVNYLYNLTYELDNSLYRFIFYFISFLLLTCYLFLFILSLFSIYYLYLAITGIKSREFIKNIKRTDKIKVRACLMEYLVDHKIISCNSNHNTI
ncbi:palmitoyltransferase, carnitine acyltransferase [Vairimorpha necatrix]|uniref:Palmitoyltransferase n=1 Tax=Vairimorpha necatrix TaxID=6039 RepID=A0AAX4JDV0_9MICR